MRDGLIGWWDYLNQKMLVERGNEDRVWLETSIGTLPVMNEIFDIVDGGYMEQCSM